MEPLVSRTFEAPRQLVWDAFTKAEHLAHWWGAKGSKIEVEKMELKKGGVFHYSMTVGEMKVWGKFVYGDMQEPEFLEFINCFSDENEGVKPNPWMGDWPLEIFNRWDFTEENGKCTVHINGHPVDATPEQLKMYEEAKPHIAKGFDGTFSALDEYLASIK